ncbi:MAG: type IV toxin-antitoxin system AbiEi family antitoxin domain-containing protein [Solirubrobacteraceae bacterium]
MHARRAFDHPGGRALAHIAGRQRGVVARAQLGELGLSRGQIERLTRNGWLQPLYRGVFAVGHRHLTDWAHLLAALLSFDSHAFLSHRTAAAVWGLRAVNVHNIEVTVPGTGGRVREGLTVHRTRTEPHPDDIRTRGELRVSSVPRMLVELAPHETPAELARLITMAVQKSLLPLHRAEARERLEAALARHERRPGMGKLTAVLAAYRRTESSKSGLERAFDNLLAQHSEIPDPQRNIHIDHWEIDRFWPERNLAVELDGRPYHIAAGEMERDRIKDAALLRRGITPLRFTDFRVEHDVRGILGDLRHFLAVDG